MAPTYDVPDRFWREFERLDARAQRDFLTAKDRMIAGLEDEPPSFHPSLRIKRVQGHAGVWEITFAPDGRATFEYGPSLGSGPHIIWRRIGTHNVLTDP